MRRDLQPVLVGYPNDLADPCLRQIRFRILEAHVAMRGRSLDHVYATRDVLLQAVFDVVDALQFDRHLRPGGSVEAGAKTSTYIAVRAVHVKAGG